MDMTMLSEDKKSTDKIVWTTCMYKYNPFQSDISMRYDICHQIMY